MKALSLTAGAAVALAACSAAHAVDCTALYNDSRLQLIVQIEAVRMFKDRYPSLSLPPGASLFDKREFLELLRAVLEMEQRAVKSLGATIDNQCVPANKAEENADRLRTLEDSLRAATTLYNKIAGAANG